MSAPEIPSNQRIEEVFRTAPNELLDKLPDCDDTRAARGFLESAERMAHRAREQASVGTPS